MVKSWEPGKATVVLPVLELVGYVIMSISHLFLILFVFYHLFVFYPFVPYNAPLCVWVEL